MKDFQVGDKVRCIRNNDICDIYLNTSIIYTVKYVGIYFIKLEELVSLFPLGFDKERFEKVEDIKKLSIVNNNNFLNDDKIISLKFY